jgi:hypothetical protein
MRRALVYTVSILHIHSRGRAARSLSKGNASVRPMSTGTTAKPGTTVPEPRSSWKILTAQLMESRS